MNKLLLTLFLLIVLSACASTKKTLNTWLGSSKQQLILKWGPPDRTASDGGTGEILVYASQIYYPGINGTGAYTYWYYKYMYANSEGIIYHWLTKAEQIPPTQIDLTIYKH